MLRSRQSRSASTESWSRPLGNRSLLCLVLNTCSCLLNRRKLLNILTAVLCRIYGPTWPEPRRLQAPSASQATPLGSVGGPVGGQPRPQQTPVSQPHKDPIVSNPRQGSLGLLDPSQQLPAASSAGEISWHG